MRIIKLVLIILILVFACVGLLFTGVFIAMQFDWLNVSGSIDARNESLLPTIVVPTTPDSDRPDVSSTQTPPVIIGPDYSCVADATTCLWFDTREWSVVAGGLTKDTELINRVAAETGVSPRLIAAVVVPEQIRFFTSN